MIILSGGFLLWQLFGPSGQPQNEQTVTNGPINLIFWGVYDDPSIFQPIIDSYHKIHPNVNIAYVRKDSSLYEFASLNLLASQDGPDIWLIPSEWLPKHRDKLQPLPAGLLDKQNPAAKKKRTLFARPPKTLSNSELYPKLFAAFTADDNIVNNQVFALPLAADTLGLYVNKSALAQTGLGTTGPVLAPITWDKIIELVGKLAVKSGVTVSKPAIALGTSNNVSQATDILATLMMQNHTRLVSDERTEASYNQAVLKTTGEPIKPAELAVDFYTSFASPTKTNYNWNGGLPNDFELFAGGSLPFYIDYSYRVRDLIQKNPSLDFATSSLPQIAGTDSPVTLGTALVAGVPTVSRHPQEAWDFVSWLTNQSNSLAYARAAGRPPARIDLTEDPAFDPRLIPFISQIAYAKSWYRNDINKTATVLRAGIDSALGGEPIPNVVDKMTKQVTHILRGEPFE